MNVNITSKECAWANFEVKILGRTVKGLRGFSAKKSKDQEHLYGAGDEPIDIMSGNKKYEGNVKLLGFEVDALDAIAQAAQYDDITEVPHDLIVITIAYKKRPKDPVKVYTATGVSFGETGIDLEQNAKHRETTIPFLCMNLDHQPL